MEIKKNFTLEQDLRGEWLRGRRADEVLENRRSGRGLGISLSRMMRENMRAMRNTSLHLLFLWLCVGSIVCEVAAMDFTSRLYYFFLLIKENFMKTKNKTLLLFLMH